ncbi:MAG: transposase, partial [Acidobacteria bacterium]|nr:transposase [Acidobacteriota bacterium]
ELVVKYKKRFEKNRGKLFTFLDYDGVPWNNNNAEHAIKAFAMLRTAIRGASSEKGIREYLTLLSVCETCKYKGVSFLKFLRSGEKDVDEFIKKINHL